MAREVRLIRALADEGFAYRLNGGVPPIPHNKWVIFVTLPKRVATRLRNEIEAAGVPVIQLRGEGQINPDGVRDYDLLIPAEVEVKVVERWGTAREAALVEAEAWRESLRAAAI